MRLLLSYQITRYFIVDSSTGWPLTKIMWLTIADWVFSCNYFGDSLRPLHVSSVATWHLSYFPNVYITFVPILSRILVTSTIWHRRSCSVSVYWGLKTLTLGLFWWLLQFILSRYQFGPTQHWKRLVELVCGLFFVIDYIFNIYRYATLAHLIPSKGNPRYETFCWFRSSFTRKYIIELSMQVKGLGFMAFKARSTIIWCLNHLINVNYWSQIWQTRG